MRLRVTPANLSHRPGRAAAVAHTICTVRYTVMIRVDEAGRCPVLIHERDKLLTDPGVRWRLVTTTDDYAEAIWLMEVARRYCEEGT